MHTIKSVVVAHIENTISIGFDRGEEHFKVYYPHDNILDRLLSILYTAQIVPIPDPFCNPDLFFLRYDIRDRES